MAQFYRSQWHLNRPLVAGWCGMLRCCVDSVSPLTLVHLLEPGGGGTMRHVMDLAAAQVRAGHHVHVIYSPLRLDPLFATQLDGLALSGVTMHSLPLRRAPHIDDIKNILALVEILRALKPHGRPDILHAHSTKAGLIARLVGLFVKTCVIYTPHALLTLDPATSQWKVMLYGCYERILLPMMRRMIVLSRHEYDHAVGLGVPRAQLVMGLNGITALPPSDRAAMHAAWGVGPDEIVVGFIGRLVRQKNPELAIMAFAKARAQSPKLRLVILGDGELRSACELLAQQFNISAHIIWLGTVDARPFYAGMDILLITSRYEGMAYTFIEALHAGVPVITTDVGGSDSCVMAGQTGFVVPPDADTIADAMVRLANDAPLRDAMHFTARAAARHFTLVEMVAVHEAIYREALHAPEHPFNFKQ